MATETEIEKILEQDHEFQQLLKSDEGAATKYATEMFTQLKDVEMPKEPQAGPVRTYARPLLEGAGMIAGTIAGAAAAPVLGPLGVAAGNILGTAGGSAIADVAEQFAGEQPVPKNAKDAISNTVTNLQTGFMSEIGGQALNLATKGVQKAFHPFSGMIDAGKQRIKTMAEGMGVNLSAGDITGSRFLSSLVEGVADKVPFSAGQVHSFRLEGVKKLVERRNALLEHGGTPISIEETGQLIKDRVTNLVDQAGVTNAQARQSLLDSTLQRLGSTETYEALGLEGQQAMTRHLTQKSDQVNNAYSHAYGLFPQGAKVEPTNLRNTVADIENTLSGIEPELIDKRLGSFLKQFKSSGNPRYDAQQEVLQQAKEEMRGMPATRWDPKTKTMVNNEAPDPLNGQPVETPGYEPRQLNELRSRLNTAINEIDAGLKTTGQVGIKGMGESRPNIDKRYLLQLKTALDADVNATSNAMGGEIQEAFTLARTAAGELKGTANAKGTKAFLRARPQEAARMLAQSKDLQTIRQMRTVMGDGFRPVQESFANEILGAGKEGMITPAMIRGQLNQYKKGVAESMLGDGQVRQLRNLATQLETQDAAAIQNPWFKRLLKVDPEKVVDYIVKPNNTENIKAARRLLGEDAVKDIGRGLANKVLRKPTYDMPEEEFVISPARLLSGLKRLGDDTLKEVYKHDPTFLKDMKELAEVANASQGAAKVAANPSGTAKNMIAFSQGMLMLYNWKLGAAVALGVPAATKLYLSPMGRKWLTEGFKTSPHTAEAMKLNGQIMGLLTADTVQDKR